MRKIVLIFLLLLLTSCATQQKKNVAIRVDTPVSRVVVVITEGEESVNIGDSVKEEKK